MYGPTVFGAAMTTTLLEELAGQPQQQLPPPVATFHGGPPRCPLAVQGQPRGAPSPYKVNPAVPAPFATPAATALPEFDHASIAVSVVVSPAQAHAAATADAKPEPGPAKPRWDGGTLKIRGFRTLTGVKVLDRGDTAVLRQGRPEHADTKNLSVIAFADPVVLRVSSPLNHFRIVLFWA